MNITDVKPPHQKTENSAYKSSNLINRPNKSKFITKTKIVIKLLGLIIVISLILYVNNIFNLKNSASSSIKTVFSEMGKIKEAAKAFKTEDITKSLEITNKNIERIKFQTEESGLLKLASILSNLIPDLKSLPVSIRALSELNLKSLEVAKDIDYLKNNGIQLITQKRGAELVGILERLKNNLTGLENISTKLKNYSFQLKNLSPELARITDTFGKNYISISLNLYRTNDFLESLISLLNQPNDQHLLLIFQNQSEMRPSGGFIGSYGDITLNQGNLLDIRVDDIYNADRQLNLKIIPPRELQGITRNWGARDANWFFDFPTSAKKVIQLLEQDDLHLQKSIRFQGAVAINTAVLGTLIDIIGPIKLTEYGLILNKDNFLTEIQREVEAGRDKKPGQNPKKILSVLTPVIFEKLQSLSDEQKSMLIEGFKNHISNKDIMIYFKDSKLQNFLENIGVGGEILELPENPSGDYLAVVNANIGAGKTDAFINQQINLRSKISTAGTISNELSISRTHGGQNEKDWWYRINNKNYLKILVPAKTKLISIEGNNPPPTQKEYDYKTNDYQTDFDLQMIENPAETVSELNSSIGKEFNKTSIGTWFSTPAGKTKSIIIIYKNGENLKIKNGLEYNFIFEKQSGSQTSLDYSITAPPGYIWKESGKEIFSYSADQIRAREIIKLTLIEQNPIKNLDL